MGGQNVNLKDFGRATYKVIVMSTLANKFQGRAKAPLNETLAKAPPLNETLAGRVYIQLINLVVTFKLCGIYIYKTVFRK